MALYLEQDLKLAQETECWKGCSLWATGKRHVRVPGGSVCYQMGTAVARHTRSDRGGRWVFEACGCLVHPHAGSAGCGFCIYLEFLARETMQKQTQNPCCTQTFPRSWSCWNTFSYSIQALWQNWLDLDNKNYSDLKSIKWIRPQWDDAVNVTIRLILLSGEHTTQINPSPLLSTRRSISTQW